MNNQKRYTDIFGVNNQAVIIIDSWKVWKTLTLLGCVHGDEAVWIDVFEYLLNDFWIQKKLKSWKIQLILWNIQWFLNWKKYIDTDLNRIWNFPESKKWTYEYIRAQEILPYLEASDYIIDIHSTTNPSSSICIPNTRVTPWCLDFIPTEYIVSWILPYFHGRPLIAFDLDDTKTIRESLVIEGGQTGSFFTTFQAQETVLHVLGYYGLISYISHTEEKTKQLTVKWVFQAKSMKIEFTYSDIPQSFDFIEKGTPIYTDNHENIYAQKDCYILMPTLPRYIGEEIWFICVEK